MKKVTKVLLISAAVLVAVGLIVFLAEMAKNQWDFAKLNTDQYETNSYKIDEDFSNLSISTDTADIIFELSDDGQCRVECYEKVKHTVSVQDDTLMIDLTDEGPWYEQIGFHFGSPKITLSLPKEEYTSLLISESTGNIEIPKEFRFQDIDISPSTGDVDLLSSASDRIKINASTGNLRIENISAGSLDLSVSTGTVTAAGINCPGDFTVVVSTGKAYLTDVDCKNLISSGTTGDLALKNVIAAENFSLRRTTGDIAFDGCDAAEITVETETGEVMGSLLSEKVFFTETASGKIDVPKTAGGGICEISTDTGNIEIEID